MTGPSLLELLVVCCVLDLFDPEILVKIMWYVPPTISGGGNDFLGGRFFFIRIEARNPRGKREWEMTFEVRFFFPWTNKERQISRENDQISAFKFWPAYYVYIYIYTFYMWTRNRAISTGNFVSQLKFLSWNYVNFGCGPLPACGDCQLLLGGGPHQTYTFINESNLLLGRCLHLFTILFLRKLAWSGGQFCLLWTWQVFFLLDLKPRTRNGYVCLKRNDFPQRRKGRTF